MLIKPIYFQPLFHTKSPLQSCHSISDAGTSRHCQLKNMNNQLIVATCYPKNDNCEIEKQLSLHNGKQTSTAKPVGHLYH